MKKKKIIAVALGVVCLVGAFFAGFFRFFRPRRIESRSITRARPDGKQDKRPDFRIISRFSGLVKVIRPVFVFFKRFFRNGLFRRFRGDSIRPKRRHRSLRRL